MTSSYTAALKELFNLHKDAEKWTSGAINVPIATSLTDDTPMELNLTATVGHDKYTPREHKRSDSNCYWLAQALNENNAHFRQTKIYPIFVRACHTAGFIIHGEYDKSRKNIKFSCMMSKYHDEEREKKS